MKNFLAVMLTLASFSAFAVTEERSLLDITGTIIATIVEPGGISLAHDSEFQTLGYRCDLSMITISPKLRKIPEGKRLYLTNIEKRGAYYKITVDQDRDIKTIDVAMFGENPSLKDLEKACPGLKLEL
jgi:hypothetical protein